MKNVFLTCWFNNKKDPQRNLVQPADFEKIRLMVKSSNTCGVKVILFHDCFNNKTIKKYESDLLKFIRPNQNIRDTPFSTNDFRFLVYLDYLKSNQIDNVFMLDASDIIVKNNPFNNIEENKIYTGCEAWTIAKKPRISNKVKGTFGKVYYGNKLILNAGILGGNKKLLLPLLEEMKKVFDKKKHMHNINMPVFNKCIRDLFSDEQIITKDPVCSNWKKYENHRKDVWFIHK